MDARRAGFGTIELLIIVLIIGLAGALAWTTLYRSSDAAPDDTATSSQTENAAQQAEAELASETVDWKTEPVERYGISYKYPSGDGWEPTFAILDMLTPGHEAVLGVNYTKCGANCGYALSIGVFIREFEAGAQKNFAEEQMNDNTYYSLVSKNTVTIDGVEGTRWEYAPADSGAATIIYYYFQAGDFSYTLAINSNGAMTDAVDLTAIGDTIAKTIHFTD